MTADKLLQKLKIGAEESFLILNLPASLQGPALQEIGHNTAPQPGKAYAHVLLFVSAAAEIQRQIPIVLAAIAAGGKLWIAYPKKSSSIKTDISRDTGWAPVAAAGWGPVIQIAIDDTWSALRFKPEAEIKRKAGSMVHSNPAERAIERKPLEVPDYLQSLLEQHPAEKAFFDGLAYTHRKAYINWIIEAKRPETRKKRLEKMLAMLQQGKKGR